MNRSLLLVVCDFLLLSMLALARFDSPEQEEPTEGASRIDARAEAAEQDDLLDIMELALEKEQESRRELTASLAETREELDAREQALRDREEALTETQQSLARKEQTTEELAAEKARVEAEREQLAAEREQLAELAEARQAELARAEAARANLATDMSSLKEESAAARERLRAMEERLAEREAALARVEAERQRLADERERLAGERARMETRLEVVQTERRQLEENLNVARTEVANVRREKEQLVTATGELSAGVSDLARETGQLARETTEVKEEIQRAQPKTMSAIFEAFAGNRVTVLFSSEHGGFLGSRSREFSISTTAVEANGQGFILVHARETPFAVTGNRGSIQRASGEIQIGRQTLTIGQVHFLAGDPRLLAIPVQERTLKALGVEPFALTSEPFRFAEAILVDTSNNFFGETGFRTEPGAERYLRMDNRIFNRLFGEFSPSRGDLVFAKSGELLGVMVNNSFAAQLDSLELGEGIQLGRDFEESTANAVIERMEARVEGLPASLR